MIFRDIEENRHVRPELLYGLQLEAAYLCYDEARLLPLHYVIDERVSYISANEHVLKCGW